jgi:hypothetical protein
MTVYQTAQRRVEKKLNRKLNPGEVVHHKDHNPQNNTDFNLEPLSEQEHNILHFRGKNALYKFRRKNT